MTLYGLFLSQYRQLVESGVIQAEKARGTPPMKRKKNKVAKVWSSFFQWFPNDRDLFSTYKDGKTRTRGESVRNKRSRFLPPSTKLRKCEWARFKDKLKFFAFRWRKLQEESQVDLGLSGGGKLWMGKDYVNFIHKDFMDLDLPFHGIFSFYDIDD